MKDIQKIVLLYLSVTVLFSSCANDDDGLILSEDDLGTPSNVTATFDITNDNTGTFTVTPAALAASSFQILFGDEVDGEEPTTVLPGQSAENIYDEGDFVLTVTAVGLTGKTASITENVVIRFDPPENLEISITTENLSTSVIPEADGATLFDIFFGIASDEEAVTIMPGDTASVIYPDVGEYIIKTVARGAGAASIERNDTIQISQSILLPIDFESNVINFNFTEFEGAPTEAIDNPASGGINESSRVARTIKSSGSSTSAGAFIDLSEPINFSTLTAFSIAVNTPKVGDIVKLRLEPLTGSAMGREIDVATTLANEWEELVFDFSGFDLSMADFQRMVFFFDFGNTGDDSEYLFDDIRQIMADEGSGSVELLVNGDFENGSEGWTVGVGTDPAPVLTEGSNSFYSVEITSPNPDEPFLINLSQKLEIISGLSYILTFDAWSDRDRGIIAGIGLSGGTFANTTETVNISDVRETYKLVLLADGFGASDARVLFDNNGEAGLVNIDDVSLVLFDDGLLTNGDFQNGSESWLAGVETDPAPVVTENGNTFYSVEITSPNPDEPFLVNLSQKLEIVQGLTYRLSFNAWSDRSRDIIAGIGLSGGTFANTTVPVSITVERRTYELILTATDFGASDARVLFDSNGEAGLVNIDNVVLVLDE
ncbi:MAG: hypothetical protein AAF519_14195 [Bacteroidota bacterium]